MRRWWRRPWTLVIVGRYSKRRVALDSLYRFRTMRDALAKATELNGQSSTEVVTFEVQER